MTRPGSPAESPTDWDRERPYRRLLFGLLGAAVVLRVALVLSGGQKFWPDEIRYDRARAATEALWQGDLAAARRAVAHPEHSLFSIIGLLPAAIEQVAGRDDRIPSLFFSLFSVMSIALLYGLVRQLGESEPAACLAALLLGLSTTHLYYARHLLPYDAAMAFGLGALTAAVRPTSNLKGTVLCGVLAGATLLTYNGYFLLAGSALVMNVLWASSRRDAARRLGVGAAACALPLAATTVVGTLQNGDFLRGWGDFITGVTQGKFAEGWRLPFSYLWHAEHLLTALWAAAFLFAAVRLVRGDRSRAFLFGVAGILLIYAGLVVGSVSLRKFVVYGRLVRQLVPFACVLSAVAIQRIAATGSRGRIVGRAAVVGAICQAAWNFHPPLVQVFPADFRRMAAEIPNPGRRPRMLLYADFIYPKPVLPPAEGAVLLARRHPLQFLPYQYEGYGPDVREDLRTVNIEMRLVEAPLRSGPADDQAVSASPPR
ncbi:MAG: glycosyltransferase family 39 protein [Thermoanaerobaculia bacterium]